MPKQAVPPCLLWDVECVLFPVRCLLFCFRRMACHDDSPSERGLGLMSEAGSPSDGYQIGSKSSRSGFVSSTEANRQSAAPCFSRNALRSASRLRAVGAIIKTVN